MLRGSWAVPAVAGLCCCVVVGCGGSGNQNAQNAQASADTTAKTQTTAAAAGETTTPLTDANILALMHQADSAEIGAAKIALKKAQASSVKGFARKMIHDHSRLDAEATRAGKAANITPQAPADDTLPEHAQHETAQLDSASGPAFDQTYMSDQVADHQTVLTLLQQAQNSAQNPRVKAVVDTAVKVVQQHLDDAQKVQSGLKPAA